MKLGIAGRVNGIEVTDADYADTAWSIPPPKIAPPTLPSLHTGHGLDYAPASYPDSYDDSEPPTLRRPSCHFVPA